MRFLMVAVAHQVEHRIVTPEVAGSRPVSHPNNSQYNQQLATPLRNYTHSTPNLPVICRQLLGVCRQTPGV